MPATSCGDASLARDPALCNELFGQSEDNWAFSGCPSGLVLGLRLTDELIRRYSVDSKAAERTGH